MVQEPSHVCQNSQCRVKFRPLVSQGRPRLLSRLGHAGVAQKQTESTDPDRGPRQTRAAPELAVMSEATHCSTPSHGLQQRIDPRARDSCIVCLPNLLRRSVRVLHRCRRRPKQCATSKAQVTPAPGLKRTGHTLFTKPTFELLGALGCCSFSHCNSSLTELSRPPVSMQHVTPQLLCHLSPSPVPSFSSPPFPFYDLLDPAVSSDRGDNS